MKRVPIAIALLIIVFTFVAVSRLFLADSIDLLEQQIVAIEQNPEDKQAIEQIKSTFAKRQRWMMMIADRDGTLQLGTVINELSADAESEETLLQVGHVKAQLTRCEHLFLAVF